MNTSIRELNRRASIIKGYEEGILKILEKWRVCDRDVDKIQDFIAKIESDTIELVNTKIKLES